MSSIDLFKNIAKSLDDFPDLKKEITSTNKTFQFNVSDGNPYYVQAGNGEVKIVEGTAPSASATITSTEQVLTDLFTGKLNGVQAFMQGKLKISGDIFAVQKLSNDILKARK